MSETAKTMFSTARDLICVGRPEDGATHYYQAQKDGFDNAEAEFFGAYLGYLQLAEAGNYASAANAYQAMINSAADAVRFVAEYEENGVKEDEMPIRRQLLVEAIVKAIVPINRYLAGVYFSNALLQKGIVCMYGLGDAIQQHFGDDLGFALSAVEVWKEAVALQRKYYGSKCEGIQPETYAEKIKSVDSDYEMPAKSGCISLG